MMALTCVFFYIFTPEISRLYNLSDEALRLSVICNRICLVNTIFFWPLSFTLPNFLRAAGDARYTMTISMISMWTFRISLAYILGRAFGLGLIGTTWAMIVDWYFRLTLFSIRWIKGRWMTKKVI